MRALITSFVLCAGVVLPPSLPAQTFVQLPDMGSGVGARLTRTVTLAQVNRRLFGDVGGKVTYINGTTVYQLATDPTWGRALVGRMGEWVHSYNNHGGPGGRLLRPTGVDITGGRKVFIADRLGRQVLRTTLDLNVGNLTQPMSLQSASQMPRPVDVAWDGRTTPLTTAFLYVIDDSLNRVSYWDVTGTSPVYQWSYGTTGSGVNQFNHPTGVCVGKSAASNGGTQFTNHVYVVDRGNQRLVRLQRISNGLQWIESVNLGSWDPVDCTVDHFGNVYVADNSNHRIHKFTQYTQFLTSYGSYGTGPASTNTFAFPYAVSVPCGSKVVNGQSVWYCEGRLVTAERWSDSTGALEHYLGMWGTIGEPNVGDPDASVQFTAMDHAYVNADVFGQGVGLVKTLVSGSFWPSGSYNLWWDGRLANGQIAPDGYYQFRVVLSSAYTCPSGASWCWKTLYSSLFFHRFCQEGGGGGEIPLRAASTAALESDRPRRERENDRGRPPVDQEAQTPPPTCGEGGGGLPSFVHLLGVPRRFGVRQLASAPASVGEVLTSLSSVAGLRPSLSIVGDAIDVPGEEVISLRQRVMENGVTALQVNLSEASDVGIEVMDLSGRRVWQHQAGRHAPGMYVLRWSANTNEGTRARPGVYTAIVRAQGQQAVTRFIVPAR